MNVFRITFFGLSRARVEASLPRRFLVGIYTLVSMDRANKANWMSIPKLHWKVYLFHAEDRLFYLALCNFFGLWSHTWCMNSSVKRLQNRPIISIFKCLASNLILCACMAVFYLCAQHLSHKLISIETKILWQSRYAINKPCHYDQ